MSVDPLDVIRPVRMIVQLSECPLTNPLSPALSWAVSQTFTTRDNLGPGINCTRVIKAREKYHRIRIKSELTATVINEAE